MREDSKEDINAYNYNPNRPQGHPKTSKIADTAARGVSEYVAPGVGGQVYDAVKKTASSPKKTNDAPSAPTINNPNSPSSPLVNNTPSPNPVLNPQLKGPLKRNKISKPTKKNTPDQDQKSDPSISNVLNNNHPRNLPNFNPFRKNNNFNHDLDEEEPLKQDVEPEEPEEKIADNPEPLESKPKLAPNPEPNQTKDKDTLTKTISFAFKHKYLLLIGGIFFFFFMFILLFIILFGDTTGSSQKFGLSGYAYYKVNNLCSTVKVYNPKTNQYTKELDFETEYIPGVVQAEVGGFSNAPEVLKLFAIAARSYALNRLDSSCTIEGSARVQAFTYNADTLAKVTDATHPISIAAQETYGLVATKNGKLMSTYYDAACYRGEDANNYYIGYGRLTLGEEKRQVIPKSWQNRGFLAYMGHGDCYMGHGYGISQYGAYYLATEQNYSMEDLLKYYNGDVELKSIYEGISTNYTSPTSEGTNNILTTSLREFLKSKGTSVEALNEYILNNIITAGVGTREAAISVPVSLVGGLYENYKVRLPYTLSGQHYSNIPDYNGKNVNRPGASFYGADPAWGTAIRNSSDNSYHYGSYKYYRYGPDCSGFVTWILHNAGFNAPILGADAMGNLGEKHQLNGTQVGQPGDLLWHSGHIMFIVGVDPEAKVYYIAHASSGSQGVKINAISFNSPSNYAVDMTKWYNEHKIEMTNEEFIASYRAGYVDGYTGSNDKINIASSDDIYFVGDSRTVGLCNAISVCSSSNTCNNVACNAKVSMGYSWFKEQVNTIKNTSKKIIVINMGVNDITGSPSTTRLNTIASNYYNEYVSIAKSKPNKTIYFLSLNPVDDSKDISVSNKSINEFNSIMKSKIEEGNISNLKYLNSNSAITYKATDGLHYDRDTYKRLYSYIINSAS